MEFLTWGGMEEGLGMAVRVSLRPRCTTAVDTVDGQLGPQR